MCGASRWPNEKCVSVLCSDNPTESCYTRKQQHRDRVPFQLCLKASGNMRGSKDAKRLNRAVAEFICTDQVPIYTVETTRFRNLVHALDRKYDMPGRNYFMNNEILKMYNETNQVIQAQLQCQPCFALTTDLWTSRAVDAYMALTIQYVTETWEMPSWCLGFVFRPYCRFNP